MIVVYGLAVAHAIGAGTDATTPWLRVWLYVSTPVIEETAIVIGDGPDDLIIEAAEMCPSIAITVLDSETGSQVYP